MIHRKVEVVIGQRAYRIVRYIMSGGTAAASHILFLFLLVHLGQVQYLYASAIAFLMAAVVSFAMQKFWTFQDLPMFDVHAQFFRYLVVLFINLIINTLLMYLLVAKIGIWYLAAQVITTIIVAVVGYFGYKRFVFKERRATT